MPGDLPMGTESSANFPFRRLGPKYGIRRIGCEIAETTGNRLSPDPERFGNGHHSSLINGGLVVHLFIASFGQENANVLEDQRDLIKSLLDEKQENEKRYDAIMKAIEGKPSDGFSIASSTTLVGLPDNDFPLPKDPTMTDTFPPTLKHQQTRIQKHTQLVQRLLDEIDDVNYKLDHGPRGRLQDSVLKAHWTEWASQRQRVGIKPFEIVLVKNEAIVG